MFQVSATENNFLLGHEDYSFKRALEQFKLTLDENMALGIVYEQMWPQLLDQTADLDDLWVYRYTSVSFKIFFMSRMHHYRAIALAAACRNSILPATDEDARNELVKAGRHDSSSGVIQDHLKIIEQRLRVKNKANRNAVGTIFTDDLLSRLGEPLQVPPAEIPPSDTIAGERYLLGQLDYKGDYLLAIEESLPANKKEMKSSLKKIKEHKAQLAPGTPLRAWVSGAGKPRVSFTPPRR